jgi:hypothetical protein
MAGMMYSSRNRARQILCCPVLWFFYNSGKTKLPPSFQTVPPPNTSPLLECLHTEDPICIKLGIERRGKLLVSTSRYLAITGFGRAARTRRFRLINMQNEAMGPPPNPTVHHRFAAPLLMIYRQIREKSQFGNKYAKEL